MIALGDLLAVYPVVNGRKIRHSSAVGARNGNFSETTLAWRAALWYNGLASLRSAFGSGGQFGE